MITLDPRIGSVDLLGPLQSIGATVQLQHLEFGDAAFTGNGPAGEGCSWIGVERKRLRDMLGSIRSGRFSGHQLPGLVRCYDRAYLILEGHWRPSHDQDGLIECPHRAKESWGWEPVVIGQSRFLYRELSKFLVSVQTIAGIPVLRSRNPYETAHLIRDLEDWWTYKSWSEHRAHVAFNLTTDRGFIVKPSLLRRMAKELWQVGWELSAGVEAEFGTVVAMAGADEKRWRKIPGIGKKIASRAVRDINEGEED